ncbi:predicted protein [Histoplasma capsulatum G186AR]|uniref:Uncharacterized protein n=1 Tax=Ajellomyces capsulatus (strain G186AR / H82 / ATCC MYA-2454 / RMSCC 2432) TaxID=447093 RepID=C0NNF6_AJECG|nr:uncharacterized protein HCBG_04283 [Histoplasma capsulatum G186AR]EEH07404.1 predicted protein [Histoplasma capsulatum G186AR]
MRIPDDVSSSSYIIAPLISIQRAFEGTIGRTYIRHHRHRVGPVICHLWGINKRSLLACHGHFRFVEQPGAGTVVDRPHPGDRRLVVAPEILVGEKKKKKRKDLRGKERI